MNENTNMFTHYLSVLFAGLTGLSFDKRITLIMCLVACATFFINWYYKHRDLRLAIQTRKERLRLTNSESTDNVGRSK